MKIRSRFLQHLCESIWKLFVIKYSLTSVRFALINHLLVSKWISDSKSANSWWYSGLFSLLLNNMHNFSFAVCATNMKVNYDIIMIILPVGNNSKEDLGLNSNIKSRKKWYNCRLDRVESISNHCLRVVILSSLSLMAKSVQRRDLTPVLCQLKYSRFVKFWFLVRE